MLVVDFELSFARCSLLVMLSQNSSTLVTHNLDFPFPTSIASLMEARSLPTKAASTATPAAPRSGQIGWIALTLTPGLGPTRSRKLIEFFGGIEAVLNASLTALEAAGLPVTAAQSLGTGKSLELAQDEIAKADAAGVQLVTVRRLPLSRAAAANLRPSADAVHSRQCRRSAPARNRGDRHATSHALWNGNGRAPGM